MKYIYLDENLSEYVAEALGFLNKGYFKDIQVYSTKEKFGKGAPDEEIIPSIAKQKGVLITRDFRIHKNKLQYELYQKHGLGVFFISLPKGMNKHWELVKVLINSWENIVQNINSEKMPFAFRIHIKGKMEKL